MTLAKALYRALKIPKSEKKKGHKLIILTSTLRNLEKEEQTKPQSSRRRDILKNRAEINKIQNLKLIGS